MRWSENKPNNINDLKFSYLWNEITSKISAEVSKPANQRSKVSGCLDETLWKKHKNHYGSKRKYNSLKASFNKVRNKKNRTNNIMELHWKRSIPERKKQYYMLIDVI